VIGARIEGGEALSANLLTLSSRVSRKLVREALFEGGEVIRQRASELAPREPGPPDLADNIVMNHARQTREREGGVAIGPRARAFFYGMFQEFGTSRHAAQPFMRPAFDETWRVALAIISGSLWRELAGRGIHRPTTTGVGPVSGGPGGGLL
jgi:HK97 gp10 family phage protein